MQRPKGVTGSPYVSKEGKKADSQFRGKVGNSVNGSKFNEAARTAFDKPKHGSIPVNQKGQGPTPLASQTKQAVDSVIDQRRHGPKDSRQQKAARKVFNVNDVGLERTARTVASKVFSPRKRRESR